jgi:hypothetical protein
MVGEGEDPDLPHGIEERERAAEVGGIDLNALLAHRVEHAGLEPGIPADRPDLLDDQRLDVVRGDRGMSASTVRVTVSCSAWRAKILRTSFASALFTTIRPPSGATS